MTSENLFASPIVSPSAYVSERGVPLFKKGAINVFATLPCPLKVRFKAEFEPFIAQHSEHNETPIYCPTILDGKPKALEEQLFNATSEDDLPDVMLTTGMNLVFSKSFRPKFFDTGVYLGVNHPDHFAKLPETFRRAAEDYNIGFLAFGSWNLVWDRTLAKTASLPTSWAELAKPEFAKMLSIHGYQGKMSATSLLLVLKERLGEAAIEQFAGNIKNIWHFAEVIKNLDTNRAERAPFNILPNAASSQMPTTKNAAMLEFRDGPLLAPMMLFVKKSRLAACKPVLDYFWGESFRTILARGDFQFPDRIDWSRPFTYPNWETLASRDYAELSAEVNDVFQRGLQAACEVPA